MIRVRQISRLEYVLSVYFYIFSELTVTFLQLAMRTGDNFTLKCSRGKIIAYFKIVTSGNEG